MGELGILNVGAGDTKLTFDKSKPEERKRAAAVVTDMLKRGFAILVQVGTRKGKPLYQRAEAFDPNTCEYIIVGGPEEAPAAAPASQKRDDHQKRAASRYRPRRRVAADGTNAISVARSAGG